MRFILLHNNVVRLLRLALKYYDRGIEVPLSDYVRVRLGHAPAPKRRRHCDYESESESDLSSGSGYVPAPPSECLDLEENLDDLSYDYEGPGFAST